MPEINLGLGPRHHTKLADLGSSSFTLVTSTLRNLPTLRYHSSLTMLSVKFLLHPTNFTFSHTNLFLSPWLSVSPSAPTVSFYEYLFSLTYFRAYGNDWCNCLRLPQILPPSSKAMKVSLRNVITVCLLYHFRWVERNTYKGGLGGNWSAQCITRWLVYRPVGKRKY